MGGDKRHVIPPMLKHGGDTSPPSPPGFTPLILGPLFFSICINDLITVSNKLKFIMYADDTTIYFNLEDFDPYNLERDINNELEKITLWLKMNKLSLNVQKTKLMIFHTRQKQINERNISINDTDIERVESFNFLGLHIHESLS